MTSSGAPRFERVVDAVQIARRSLVSDGGGVVNRCRRRCREACRVLAGKNDGITDAPLFVGVPRLAGRKRETSGSDHHPTHRRSSSSQRRSQEALAGFLIHGGFVH